MTQVKMLETHPGSEDGLRVKMYMAGKIYDIGTDLLLNFLQMKCVEVIEDRFDKNELPDKPQETPTIKEPIKEEPKRGRGRPRKNA